MDVVAPSSAREAADALRAASSGGLAVRFRGGGTKARWGNVVPEPDMEIVTKGLGRIVEHNPGDLTAVLEAGVTVAEAQRVFAEAGQMLAVGPFRPNATIGGVVATADYGSLRHRFGSIRDQLLGMTVVLSDGTVGKSGGKVIKNVAGYDLAKLFAGSFGTLGMITEVSVRLHPKPVDPRRLVARTNEPDQLQRAVLALAHQPLELDSVDLWWFYGASHVVLGWCGVRPDVTEERVRTLFAGQGFAPDSIGSDVPSTWFGGSGYGG